MTERLYYTDAYLTDFDATVTARSADGLRIYLDRTAFYPTSGGQPHDLGTLGGIAVRDVVDEEDRIAHLLEAPLGAEVTRVAGRVTWERRHDHMQQHTGQHLLSALFADRHRWATVSVHFGAAASTIDLASDGVSAEVLRAVEREANALVWEQRPVRVSFEEAATARGLRKPTDRSGTIRVVAIEGVDRSACGGTHVRHTGELGPVLLRRTEKVKQGTRVEFLCGARAVARARGDCETLQRLSQAFSASVEELPSLLERQREAARDAEKERLRLQRELAGFRGRELYERTTPDAQGRRVVVERGASVADELKLLAEGVCAQPRALFVGLLASPPTLLVGASADAGVNAGAVVKEVAAATGGRGGGSPTMAQGRLGEGASAEEVLAQVHEICCRVGAQ